MARRVRFRLPRLPTREGLQEGLRRAATPLLLWVVLCMPVTLGAWYAEPAAMALPADALRGEYDDPLERTLRLGADWLLRDQNADGSFRYEYDFAADRYTGGENIIRQAGTAYAVAYLCGVMDDAALCAAARQALGFLAAQLEHDDTGAFILHYSIAATGATALGLVAFCTYELATGSTAYRDEMRGMADHLMAMQHANGSFGAYHRIGWFFSRERHVSVYAGEAMYALALMHQLTGDADYRQAYDRALPWYYDFWNATVETMFYAWGAKAGYHMYRATGNAGYAALTFTMTDRIVGWQNRDSASDGYGSYHYDVSIGSATFSEGVGDSLFLAAMLNDTARVDRYAGALNLSVRSVAKLQVGPALLGDAPHPLRALGGFRAQLGDDRVRIDHTQHAVSAIAKWLCWERGDCPAA